MLDQWYMRLGSLSPQNSHSLGLPSFLLTQLWSAVIVMPSSFQFGLFLPSISGHFLPLFQGSCPFLKSPGLSHVLGFPLFQEGFPFFAQDLEQKRTPFGRLGQPNQEARLTLGGFWNSFPHCLQFFDSFSIHTKHRQLSSFCKLLLLRRW